MRSIAVSMVAAFLVFGGVELLAQERAASTKKDTTKGMTAIQEVEAIGTGTTQEEAFNQAVVDAVRQAVGTLVSAENIVKNDALIKNEILTLSNGFVEKVLNQNKRKQSDGTWMITLKCVVRKGALTNTLRNFKVPTQHFDGVSLDAEFNSQLKLGNEIAGMLKSACKELQPSQLVICSMVGEKPSIESIANGNNSNAIVSVVIQIRVAINLERYFHSAAPKLEPILSNLALAQSKDIKDYIRNGRSHGVELDKFAEPISGSLLVGAPDLESFTRKLQQDSFYIYGLPIRSNKDYSEWIYKMFALPRRAPGASNNSPLTENGDFPRDGYIRIHFLRGDASVVKEENVVLYTLGRIAQLEGFQSFVPLFTRYTPVAGNRAHASRWGDYCTPAFQVEYTTQLSVREISEIKTVKVTADKNKVDEN